ncbi:MAG TPA: YdeI/OmpD-associated family protein [Candidatus Saccharimonadales bacterium]|jgi:uncharacterized protein YdeI (YjbR/CyaY-like superfamily)
MMETFNDIPVMSFEDSRAWETWLKANYDLQTGIWMKVARKDSGIASVSLTDALDICLCYGWIDGQRRSYDNLFFLQKYTPRRKKSLWSKVNIEKVATLIAAGRMQEPGQNAIDAAKKDGRWDAAYESQKNATVPPDLETALDKNLDAKEFFASLTRAERYSVLWRLMTAKSPEMRQQRLEKMVDLLKSGTKI